jgi:DNA-binding NarL/FixJ family response regulator
VASVRTVVTPPIRVLIADDTTDIRSMVRTMLELAGFDVVADVGTGGEVTALLAAGLEADVLVIDDHMPDLDGIETTRRVLATHPDQVVLLFTAFPHAALEQEASEAGVTAVLGKVDGLELLEREINRHAGGG